MRIPREPEKGRLPALPEGSGAPHGSCEAFLRGRFVDHLRMRGLAVPAWAWLNGVAHGTEAELKEVAHGGVDPYEREPADSAWTTMSVTLARDLISRAAKEGAPIGALQRERLVPLELDLAGWCGPDDDLSPERLTATVRAVLARHPSSGTRA